MVRWGAAGGSTLLMWSAAMRRTPGSIKLRRANSSLLKLSERLIKIFRAWSRSRSHSYCLKMPALLSCNTSRRSKT